MLKGKSEQYAKIADKSDAIEIFLREEKDITPQAIVDFVSLLPKPVFISPSIFECLLDSLPNLYLLALFMKDSKITLMPSRYKTILIEKIPPPKKEEEGGGWVKGGGRIGGEGGVGVGGGVGGAKIRGGGGSKIGGGGESKLGGGEGGGRKEERDGKQEEEGGRRDRIFCVEGLERWLEEGVEEKEKADAKRKIQIIFVELFEIINVKSYDDSNFDIILFKWMMMYTIEKATINDDFRILNEIGSTLSKQTETSKNYNNLIFLMDIAQKQIRKKKGFNPFKNLFFYLEGLTDDKMENTIRYFFYSSPVAFLTPTYLSNFFKNLLKSAFCNASVNFFFFFSKESLTKKKFDIFLDFFHEIVRNDLCFRLRGGDAFDNVEATLKMFYIGLIDYYTMKEEDFDSLISNYKFLASSSSSGFITKLYHLINSIVKYYQKKKKEIMREREIFNFLDFVKLFHDIGDQTDYFYQTNYYEWIIDYIPQEFVQLVEKEVVMQRKSYSGLQNLGNTCYMNSFLQALFMIKDFKSSLLLLPPPPSSSSSSLLLNLKILFQTLSLGRREEEGGGGKRREDEVYGGGYKFEDSGKREGFSMQKFKESLPEPFDKSLEQQDAMEFGRIFLDKLEEILKGSKCDKIVQNLFFGQLTNRYECKKCKYSSEKHENLLEIPINFNNDAYISGECLYDMKSMMLDFVKPEEFKDQNQYFCEKCKKLSELTIKTTIVKKLPPILLVTASRFCFDAKLGARRKLCHHLKEYLEFNVGEVFKIEGDLGKENYSLFAVIIHSGATLESGHYYTIARDLENQQNDWYVFNDLHVQYLGQEPRLNRYLWEYETPYIHFFVNEKFLKGKEKMK